jgi:hypothetical protein
VDTGNAETDRPGREVSKDHRRVIDYLIDSQGWRYELPSGGGYPMLFPADATQTPIRVPKTGHSRGYAFSNWIAVVRRKGGQWPPGRAPAEGDDGERGIGKAQGKPVEE